MQTWLSADRQQDRAVYKVSTANSQLRMKMPPQTLAASLVVAINGRTVSRRRLDADQLLTIDLTPTPPSPFVVEIWHEYERRPEVGELTFLAPQVLGSAGARRGFWQLVLPADEHVVMDQGRLSPDVRWRWQGLRFGRSSRLSQAELEQWIGASSQPELPEAVNTYLFSSFGSLDQLQVHTATRRMLLLASSGLVLVVGLLLLYFPAFRHPAVLLVAGVAIAASVFWSPSLALIFAQAAVSGLFCAMFALLLRRLYGRRASQVVFSRTPAQSSLEARSTEPHVRYEPGSQTTTAASPLVATLPLESKS
jgi:hypothetical protein